MNIEAFLPGLALQPEAFEGIVRLAHDLTTIRRGSIVHLRRLVGSEVQIEGAHIRARCRIACRQPALQLEVGPEGVDIEVCFRIIEVVIVAEVEDGPVAVVIDRGRRQDADEVDFELS